MADARMPETLAPNELNMAFPADVRSRGAQYFCEGRVRLKMVSEQEIWAEVKGTSSYTVNVELAGGELYVSCECIAFGDRGACKHIWAAILAANEHRFAAGSRAKQAYRKPTAPKKPKRAAWETKLASLANGPVYAEVSQSAWPSNRRVAFILARSDYYPQGTLLVEVTTQKASSKGGWEEPKRIQSFLDAWRRHHDLQQRQLAVLLAGSGGDDGRYFSNGTFAVEQRNYRMTLPELFRNNPCFWREFGTRALIPITWGGDAEWRLETQIVRDPDDPAKLVLDANWRRGEESRSCSAPNPICADGLLLHGNQLGLADQSQIDLAESLRSAGKIVCKHDEIDRFIASLLRTPNLPPPSLPSGVQIERAEPVPTPRLKIEKHSYGDALRARLTFSYDDQIVPVELASRAVFDEKARRLLARDPQREREFLQRLFEVGFKSQQSYGYEPALQIPSKRLSHAVAELTRDGWQVEADGKLFRSAGEFKVEVNSGIDWFDLSATVSYGDQTIGLPRLLAALHRGESTVLLDDGTLGVLPETWLKQHAHLATLGSADGDQIRFKPTQVGLLDALLAAMPTANCDAAFDAARNRLKSFSGVAPVDAPETFTGELRPYQREGLGWLNFLREFQFGGCLADDMGLGKTIQVLAMLESRRAEKLGPSLAVVPRSLVFNWMQEAARFTPNLKVLDHTGATRAKSIDGFAEHDLVLTTYGTLRKDAARFKDFEFDYVILDEAQAIKNASTESAKAARLLRGRHRLAMSGTPIENHLGELWSLIDFLNPGMLGTAGAFKNLAGASNADPEQANRALLSKAVRPFILRRTKQQVAKDLPTKTEQTIYCELDTVQRKRYDELRDFYRATLMSRIESEGINKAKIVILEALLRLRQAACHPGLIDKSLAKGPSAKLDTLLEQLREVTDEGHKALVFSQFTSMLAIVCARLDAAGVPYEYLDGQTRDRQARVERFQNHKDCKLFLISLKAGGVGLNLTSADYVFLLDPWWNPAVEAQAIDRAHRIGQTRSVFAYRLIAKDTVEEKVLELQSKKRDLADAIIGEDNSLISRMTADDLRLLLS